MTISGILAVIIGYLLGSISSAYIITRLLTGKDIRKLGGGNAGARNVYRSVGWKAAVPVIIFDVGKGAAAVAIAHWWLDTSTLFVLVAGMAAVVGHMWPIYFRFRGGNGLATTVGVLAVLMQTELLIALVIMLLLTLITRNPVLSINISLLSVPVSAWLLGKSLIPIIFPILLIMIMAIHFIPTVRAALARVGTKEKLAAGLVHNEEEEK